MAVYQGAQTRPVLAPELFPGRVRRRPASPVPERRRLRGAVRARRGANPIGFVLGGIVLAFLLSFFSLAQTVRVAATSYDIDGLSVDRERLESERRELASDLNRLGREPAIRKLSIDAGLVPLTDPLVLPAR
jgi:hypothetical protein